MALVNLPSVKGAASLEEVIDRVENMRKQVEFLLNSVEADNIVGTLRANQILIGVDSVYSSGFRENLGNLVFDWEFTDQTKWTNIACIDKTTSGVPTNAPTQKIGLLNSSRDGWYGDWFSISAEESFFTSITACNVGSTFPFSFGVHFQNDNASQETWLGGVRLDPSVTTWGSYTGNVKAPTWATKARVWFQIETFSNFGNWYFTKPVVRRQGTNLSADLKGELNIAQNTIRRDSKFYWDASGLWAVDPADSSRYVLLTSGGMEIKKGMISVEREDGFPTIIGGKVNFGFDLQGSEPPHLVDTTINGRFFETTQTNGNGGICNLYTFRRNARYVKFHLVIMSSTENESKVIVTQSGNDAVWLGSVSTTSTAENEFDLVVDLGTPDGSQYALKVWLKSYSTTNTSYCRVIRCYQTDTP